MGCASSILAAQSPVSGAGPPDTDDREPQPADHTPGIHDNAVPAGDPNPELDPDIIKLKLKNKCDSHILKANAMMQQGDHAGAIKELQDTVKTFPESARAFLDLGLSFMQLKQTDEALANLTKALELQRDLYTAWTTRARIYIQREQYVEAIADCKEAMKAYGDGNTSEAQKLRQEAEEKLELVEGGDFVADAFSSPKPRQQEKKSCVVCMDSERGCRLHPCLHFALCVECAEQLKEREFSCPICGNAIEEVEPGLFMDTFAYGDQRLANELIAVAADLRATLSPVSTPGQASPAVWSSLRADSASSVASTRFSVASAAPQHIDNPSDQAPPQPSADSSERGGILRNRSVATEDGDVGASDASNRQGHVLQQAQRDRGPEAGSVGGRESSSRGGDPARDGSSPMEVRHGAEAAATRTSYSDLRVEVAS